MAPFCAVFFPLDVLDEIWDVIESVSDGFHTYSLTFMSRKNSCSDVLSMNSFITSGPGS